MGTSIIRRPGSIKRVGYQRRHGTENKRREIENARRQDLGLPRREPRIGRSEDGDQGIDLQVLQGVPALVELEPGLLLLGHGFDGWDVSLGRWLHGRCGGVGFRRGLLGGLRGSSEHLDYLLEGVGVGLDEGGRVRVGGFGSGDGFGRLRWLKPRWCRWWWRVWMMRRSLDSIAVAAAAAATVCAVAVW